MLEENTSSKIPEPSFSMNPDFDPRNQGLPEIPDEIHEMRQTNIRRRKMYFIIIGVIAVAGFIAILIYLSIGKNKSYKYVRLSSEYTASEQDQSPGADIDAIEVSLKNLNYYADDVVSTNLDKDEVKKILGKPSENNLDFVSLGNKEDFIVVKLQADLKDENVSSLTIYESSTGSLNESYDVFIGPSKKGPWDYLGRKAGTITIDMQNYFQQ